jgi:hypothetical protein
MPWQRGDTLELPRVTRLANRSVRFLEQERVRRVALLAPDAGVKLGVRSSGLVASAAVARRRVNRAPRRMRVVTADARAGDAVLRMIGMDLVVTTGARLVWRSTHVVRRMARRATSMLRHVGSGEDSNVFVARTAHDGFALLELVRSVATNTLTVTLREQRARRDSRLVAGVALAARAERFGRRRMLMGVARRAHLRARLLLRRVRGRDIIVAIHARRRGQGGLVVGSMAFHTFARPVDGDGRRLALPGSMTTTAIGGSGSMRETSHAGVVPGALERECVTRRAVGLRCWTEAGAGLFGRVFEP